MIDDVYSIFYINAENEIESIYVFGGGDWRERLGFIVKSQSGGGSSEEQIDWDVIENEASKETEEERGSRKEKREEVSGEISGEEGSSVKQGVEVDESSSEEVSGEAEEEVSEEAEEEVSGKQRKKYQGKQRKKYQRKQRKKYQGKQRKNYFLILLLVLLILLLKILKLLKMYLIYFQTQNMKLKFVVYLKTKDYMTKSAINKSIWFICIFILMIVFRPLNINLFILFVKPTNPRILIPMMNSICMPPFHIHSY
jgi:cation transport ATPase